MHSITGDLVLYVEKTKIVEKQSKMCVHRII